MAEAAAAVPAVSRQLLAAVLRDAAMTRMMQLGVSAPDTVVQRERRESRARLSLWSAIPKDGEQARRHKAGPRLSPRSCIRPP